jgi:penicillin-binding protein 1A
MRDQQDYEKDGYIDLNNYLGQNDEEDEDLESYVEDEDNDDEVSDPDTEEDPSRRRMTRYHHQSKAGKIIKRIFAWSFTLIMLGVISGVGLFAYYAKDAPIVTQTKLQSEGSSALYTSDGKLLLTLGAERRNYLHSDEIPQRMKDAVISVEDKRFYKEPLGLDPIRIAGSLLANIKGHDISAGGSGITQQLIKLSVFSTDTSQRTLRRKAQEAWLAMQISRQYSKEQILEFYINKVYMGYNTFGLGTAASYYFGKSPSKLDLAQTALLAGMLNAPIKFDPYLYPQNAQYRRDIVLYAMLKNNKITNQEYQQAIKEPVQTGLRPRHSNNDHSERRKIDDPYIKEVVNEAQEKGFDPYNSNLKITVNIDQKAQNELYELANSNKIPFTNDKMQVGATVVDPANGHVVAIVGGRHLPNLALGYNRAVQTGRSTGSSIKPILDYAPAIEYKNWSTAQILSDTPYIYSGTNIQLFDWDNRYLGPVTMRYALEQSRNVPAVRTLEDVGFSKGIKFAKKMGINIEKKQGLSAAIGANASSLQMAGAYGALANDGVYHKPQFISKIETPDGIVRNYDTSGERVMKSSTAYMITDMLKGVITRGSGMQAKIKNLHQAGKTGTVKYSDAEMNKYPSYRGTPKDSWFAGYTPKYSIAVWTGYDTLSDGKISGQGENAAQLLYKNMMTYLMKNKGNPDWHKPDTVVSQKYLSGTAVTNELYVKGHVPKPPKIKKSKPINRSREENQKTIIYQQSQQPRVVIRQQRPRTIIRYYYR